MAFFGRNMWEEIELFQRNLRRAMRIGGDMYQQFGRMFPSLEFPRARVFDQGRNVKVVVEAPGARKNAWALKTLERTLYIRGMWNEEQSVRSDDGRYFGEMKRSQFLKSVPLPANVQRKPASIEYENGLLTLLFEKRQGRVDERWYEFKL